MVRPPTSRIMPGTPYPQKAEPWNDLVDSHQAVEGLIEQTGTIPLQLEVLHNAVVSKTYNQQRKIGEYAVCLTPITDPERSLGGFLLNPGLSTKAPNWDPADWGKSLILAQDSNKDEHVDYYYGAPAVARLKKRYAYHDHCDIDPNGSSVLVSHPSGSWQILWDNCTPNPTDPQEGWAVVRHRGIWDRTLGGTARAAIAAGTSGDVEINFNGGLTGEVVTGQYRWTGGPSIANGDTVELEWQSDELVWTVAKIGTTGGTVSLSPASQWSLPQDHSAGANEDLPWIRTAQDYNAPEIFLNVIPGDNTIIEVDREGLYRFSYNLWVKPGPYSAPTGDPDAEGASTTTKYFDARLRRNPDNELKAYQREKIIYVQDGAFVVGSGTQARAANDSSISGSAFFHLQSGETVSLGWTSEVSGHLLNGDIHVNRIREGS